MNCEGETKGVWKVKYCVVLEKGGLPFNPSLCVFRAPRINEPYPQQLAVCNGQAEN